jgi:hypothetical protein
VRLSYADHDVCDDPHTSRRRKDNPVTPVSWSLTGRESLLTILARRLGRSRLITAAFLRVLLRFLLVVAGLALLTAAAWIVTLWLGLAAAGLSCLVLEWVVKQR